MCLQRMWSISRDKDVPTKIMNRKIVDLQRIQGRVPQRRSLGVLGKDEVASSNLASSSKKNRYLWYRFFFVAAFSKYFKDTAEYPPPVFLPG